MTRDRSRARTCWALFFLPPRSPPHGARRSAPAQDRGARSSAAILQFSKVGQDIARQMQGYANQAKADLSVQGQVRCKMRAARLQQQVAILAPDVKEKRLEAFESAPRSRRCKAPPRSKDEQLKAGFCPSPP